MSVSSASSSRNCRAALDLAGHDLLRLTRLALGQRLADADQRHQAVPDSGRSLQADRAIRLAEMLAPLAVAELDEVEPAILEHQWRDLSGPGAGIRPMHVLRANLHPCRAKVCFTSRTTVKGGITKG